MQRSRLGKGIDGFNADTNQEVNEANVIDEEVGISSEHSNGHSATIPSYSTVLVNDTNLNGAQNDDLEEKLKQNSDITLTKTLKRGKRNKVKRTDSDDDNEDEDKEEEMEVDHKAMLSNADRRIQVGHDFQARVEDPQNEREYDDLTDGEREHVLWCPPSDLDNIKLNHFLEYAAKNCKLAEDQALYILQKSGFDFHVALEKVKKRKPIIEEWSEDDRTLFKQSLHMFGKRFDKIRQMMPYRSMSSIIQFYYTTKKETDCKSSIDVQMADCSEDEDCGVDQANVEADVCGNCGEQFRKAYLIDRVQLCYVCWMYFKFLGKHRPCNYFSTVNRMCHGKRRCPADMLDIAHSYVEMSSYVDYKVVPDNEKAEGIEIVQTPKTRCQEEIKAVLRELAIVRARAVRLEYSMKSHRFESYLDTLDSYRYVTNYPILHSIYFSYLAVNDKKDEEVFVRHDRVEEVEAWTEEERMIAFRCLIRYEENFAAVSEVLKTKTPEQIKNFYMEVKPDIDKLTTILFFVTQHTDITARHLS
ncbi:Myb-like DNA-binding domain protein [Dictyocaulus viviparus]|uniref:Myb-like DNA-binding domain protein n=1 Tax=Dictyocaulus viviparus TaxID=29172 RepID=A0A0D8XB41_DICVI|nr:Myb-like DNA-binding domain protein [Dictyocaulus viviparus]